MNKLIVSNQQSLEALVTQLHSAMKKNHQLVSFSDLNSRSLGQNALFHQWCGEIAKFFRDNGKIEFKATGDAMNSENMKRSLKDTFLGYEDKRSVNIKTGEITVKQELRHTSKLPKNEMASFMTLVENWAGEFDIPLTIPVASEYYELQKEAGSKV